MTENELATQIVDAAYRIHTSLGPGADMIVEDKVTVEIKSFEMVAPVHKRTAIDSSEIG